MKDDIKKKFLHESLQSPEAASDLLEALAKALADGKLVLKDDSNTITLQPANLVTMKVSASQDETANRLDIRLRWHSKERLIKNRKLSIGNK